MALWGDDKYVAMLEKELAELKEENRKLIDAILVIRGAAPISRIAIAPAPSRKRVTINDLRARAEFKERSA